MNSIALLDSGQPGPSKVRAERLTESRWAHANLE